ncbi:MAG: hypothetical protein R2787_16220 [Saprospiraceae bacterium]
MRSLYDLIKPLVFRLDAEKAHYLTMGVLQTLADIPPAHDLLHRLWYGNDTGLTTSAFGLTFRNPIGLAAGFDKDARFIREMALLGFGYIEIDGHATTPVRKPNTETVSSAPGPGTDQSNGLQ